MSNTLIQNCWNVVLQKERTLLTTVHQPLFFIDNYLSYFDLPLLPHLNVKPDALADISSVDPSFKTLTDDIIFSLRYHIYNQAKSDIVDKWAEKLMRFCEVRYRNLKTISIGKCETKAKAQLHILHLGCLFMDQSLSTKDLRFLNVALKIADLKWVIDKRSIKNGLIRRNSDFDSALFQFRLILTIEYAMSQLQKGGIK
ncbi:hypothetical protein [Candidatus Electrothrix sp.]|uniref:hypothetical protein n=1 Tax=Candidatus Electrothrix sp. TaxID=2170559 RepID=UPI00405789FB